jgi:hypothetical protein
MVHALYFSPSYLSALLMVISIGFKILYSVVQILCAHECKQKKDTCWNCFSNGGGGERRAVEGVNSSVIYLIHCKNFVNATVYPHPQQQNKINNFLILYSFLNRKYITHIHLLNFLLYPPPLTCDLPSACPVFHNIPVFVDDLYSAFTWLPSEDDLQAT